MILITRITMNATLCIAHVSVYFCIRNCFAYVVKPHRLCVCIFSTTIAGVAFILCGKLYFRHFLANSCLVWILLDVRVS